MKDRIFQTMIQHLRQNYNYVIPNCWMGFFERDILVLNNKTDYWNEYEIKMTRADFKADFKKEISLLSKVISKHGQLNTRHNDCPNRFIFVTPPNLITKDEIPDYAGLIYCDGISVNHIKTGKFIHKIPLGTQKKLYILDKLYYRYNSLHYKLRRLKKLKREQGFTEEEINYQIQ